ncbi:HNH endonuclease [Bradyrhizobium tropiciagri]|uniref:HNH endonuclease n=1 Tax=Bradyrhizobium tropiciagri TaxID=312253 RepID=UPI001BAB3588|nr:HNH endonuclease [Bradyrhizobium tropiciagri]MBR0897228.1 HNH endonuclease [Bradyrhizobium tropiciagri]
MSSFALQRLSPDQRKSLRERLWTRQNGACFITGHKMNLGSDDLEIDHIIPTRDKGPDEESNWALVFARANESKQASHLYVARVLNRLETIRKKANDPRGANLGHVLAEYGGGRYALKANIAQDSISFSLPELEQYTTTSVEVWSDELSGMRTAFMRLPIEYLHHDDKIMGRLSAVTDNVWRKVGRGLLGAHFRHGQCTERNSSNSYRRIECIRND